MFFKKKFTNQDYFEIIQESGRKLTIPTISSVDELIDWIEQQNSKFYDFGEQADLKVRKFTLNNELIYEQNIHLPVEFEMDIDQLLSNFYANKVSVSPPPIQQPVPPNNTVSYQSKLQSQPIESNFSTSSVHSKSTSRRLIFVIVGVISCLLLMGGSVFVMQILHPSFERLINQENYIKAVQLYPDRQEEVEELLFSKEFDAIPDLEKYVKTTKSKTAALDLAYLQQDYASVIAQKEAADTVRRKAELAVAYAKTGQFEEATQLNQLLKSKSIQKLITLEATERFHEALKQFNMIQATTLQELLSTPESLSELEFVKKTIETNVSIRKQLEDSSLSKEKKEELQKQLKIIEEKSEQIKKGVFK